MVGHDRHHHRHHHPRNPFSQDLIQMDLLVYELQAHPRGAQYIDETKLQYLALAVTQS
jgi:hypothetical protein